MVIKLYTNRSDKNVVTKNITEVASFTGILREGCSVIDPVIKFQNFNRSLVNQVNYAMVQEFGRYYFIKDINFIGNLTEIHMHCDVLSSFQTQLKALDAVVIRQENKSNVYLRDGIFRTYSNPKYSIVQFPTSFDTFQYVLAVSG
jgi:hypothetical protein